MTHYHTRDLGITHEHALRALCRWAKEVGTGGEVLDSMQSILRAGEIDGDAPFACLYDALYAWDYCEVARIGKKIGLRIPHRLMDLAIEEQGRKP